MAMIAFEFQGDLRPDGTVSIPKEVADELPPGMPMRVILLVDEDRRDELAFMQAGIPSFLRDEATEDADYDRYDELSGR
jgi:hypothetical protein